MAGALGDTGDRGDTSIKTSAYEGRHRAIAGRHGATQWADRLPVSP
ncbi:MAG: hypothetical protein MZU84_02525 [Sphingobacterium sp.]|nr:hypothetical protein [Sphingobacterium sp.]